MRYWIPIPQTILYTIFVVYPKDVRPTYVSPPDKIVFLLPSPFFCVAWRTQQTDFIIWWIPYCQTNIEYTDISVGKEVERKFIQQHGLPHFSPSEIRVKETTKWYSSRVSTPIQMLNISYIHSWILVQMECVQDSDPSLRHIRSLSDITRDPKQVFQKRLVFILFPQSHSIVRIRKLWNLHNLRPWDSM